MSEKKYVVPDGMLKAVIEGHPAKRMLQDDPALFGMDTLKACLEAALRWLAENPPIPTCEEASDLYHRFNSPALSNGDILRDAIREWLRTMYLAPKPRLCRHCERNVAGGMFDPSLCGPCYNTRDEWQDLEAIKDLIGGDPILTKVIVEAYRRGKKCLSTSS